MSRSKNKSYTIPEGYVIETKCYNSLLENFTQNHKRHFKVFDSHQISICFGFRQSEHFCLLKWPHSSVKIPTKPLHIFRELNQQIISMKTSTKTFFFPCDDGLPLQFNPGQTSAIKAPQMNTVFSPNSSLPTKDKFMLLVPGSDKSSQNNLDMNAFLFSLNTVSHDANHCVLTSPNS